MRGRSLSLAQEPGAGGHLVKYCGDMVRFRLLLNQDHAGAAWLRTNIGKADVRRREIVGLVEQGTAILARDWHDVPMTRVSATVYEVVLPLVEAGRFEAKAFFLPEGSDEPVWPHGANAVIKVCAADCAASNTVYTAFVRLFGAAQGRRGADPRLEQAEKTLDDAGYAVIPRSGTFRDLIRELDFIMGTLRFRIVQLLPVFPVPTTYARMGRFGSPFAALDFTQVDPAYAEFDRKTTPLEQFRELVDAVHARAGRLFIDIPVNHTGWASRLQVEHPEWFTRGKDRTFESPGAWGVTWEDLSQLDYSRKELWAHIADVFLFWCRQGVDGFRCDAGYMLPYPAWEYVVAKVRTQYPDTVFFLEGLGGKLEVVESLLDGANLDWAYSELFQVYDRGAIESYFPGCQAVSLSRGPYVHYAETHDNSRLAARSKVYARMRTALSALFSDSGAFGITCGLEWFADEKIDVHGATSLNWGAPDNQVEWVARLNAVLSTHPAFRPGTQLRLIEKGHGNCLALLRTPVSGSADAALVLVNLDEHAATDVRWDATEFAQSGGRPPVDLLTGRPVSAELENVHGLCRLGPGEVLCLSTDRQALKAVEEAVAAPRVEDAENIRQRLRARALDIHCRQQGLVDVSGLDIDGLGAALAADPIGFCAGVRDDARTAAAAVVRWEWPKDTRRTVMVSAGQWLYVTAAHRFRVELAQGETCLTQDSSLKNADGKWFALIATPADCGAHCRLQLRMTVYEPNGVQRASSEILLLQTGSAVGVRSRFPAEEVLQKDLYAICTNGIGGMGQVRGAWGEIRTQYDALLAGNLDAVNPVDRRVMFTRCRAWVVYQGYSHEVCRDCLTAFGQDGGGIVTWEFAVPCGRGKSVALDLRLEMVQGRNAVKLTFARRTNGHCADYLADDRPVKLILRPDIEDRSNHEKTKAYLGPETAWRAAVRAADQGFVFTPCDDRQLRMSVSAGEFDLEPEWRYMVAHPIDAERGFDGVSDLFSPGYFTLNLAGGTSVELAAGIVDPRHSDESVEPRARPVAASRQQERLESANLEGALRVALQRFVVRRGPSRTVIAGYPWFLDWGRDTLIALRGMIAAGMLPEARDILCAFAQFERMGTLPNMIRGNDVSNRDTSDAPLWFFVACADYLKADKGTHLLEADCGGRSLLQVLQSIAAGYMRGTPNGIRMDPGTGLVFSPEHFTWMDTNFPAATPRQGFPVEIQALWWAALNLLSRLCPEAGVWGDTAQQVREAITSWFVREHPDADAWRTVFLADTLHAAPGQPAAAAKADDAVRPNQLLALTLGVLDQAPGISASVLHTCQELLVPGGIRSLANRRVKHPVPVVRDGTLVNDPLQPYCGQYTGDEDTRRKPAYHNGTAWTWQFPSYCEALLRVCGEPARASAQALMHSVGPLMNSGCVGQLPEVMDGDAPHTFRGCGAQAWGISESYRVLKLLREG